MQHYVKILTKHSNFCFRERTWEKEGASVKIREWERGNERERKKKKMGENEKDTRERESGKELSVLVT